MTPRAACVLVAATAAMAAATAHAARPPTYLERVTIMEAFNFPGRSFASKCVRIRVSSVDPRYAMITGPIRVPRDCSQAGEVGDGYALLRRTTPKGLRWRRLTQGSDMPPCGIPARVRADLFGTADCE
jgi:hypothetical protein